MPFYGEIDRQRRTAASRARVASVKVALTASEEEALAPAA
jgi:hypothetical protein